ncbi:MAG: HAD family phosphatase [Patescibacteria group bacterium]
MSAICGIALDLEGTVVNLEHAHFRAFIMAADELGVKIDFRTITEKIPNAIGGGDKLIAKGIAELSSGKIDPDKLLALKMFHYSKLLHEVKLAPRPGFLAALKEMRKAELPVMIGSLTELGAANAILHRSGLVRYFSRNETVLLGDVREKKPAPDVYLETARRMGIEPETQLVFEDSITGITAATRAGSFVIAMPVFRKREIMDGVLDAGARRVFFGWDEMRVMNVIQNLRQE